MINAISKSIAFFENAILEIDNAPWHDIELENQRQHFVVAVDAMTLILSDPITAHRLKGKVRK